LTEHVARIARLWKGWQERRSSELFDEPANWALDSKPESD